MIKGWLTNRHKQDVFVIGLDGENFAKLLANEPVLVGIKYGDKEDEEFFITIMYGKTQKDILDEIAKHKIKLKEER